MRLAISIAALTMAASTPTNAATFIREGVGNVSGGIELIAYQGSYATAEFTFGGGTPEFINVYLDAVANQCHFRNGRCVGGDDIDSPSSGTVKPISGGFSYRFVLPTDTRGSTYQNRFYTEVLRFEARGAANLAYRLVVTTTAGPVPEPTTWAMLILGFGTVGTALRRRRNSLSRGERIRSLGAASA